MQAEGGGGHVCATFRVRAYSRTARLAAATLVALSRASLPLLLCAVVFSTDPPLVPLTLIQLFIVFAALPAGAAWLLARAANADVQVYRRELVVERRAVRLEVPTEAIARLAPWHLPLPGTGLSLRLRSGRRLRFGLQLPDPAALAAALADVAEVEAARAALSHPILVYAHARPAARTRWYHAVGKFVVFALLPTAVLFNAHQHIAYGGLLGEYYLLGLRAYVATFLLYWVTLAIYLVLFASVWRGGAEAVCLLAAAVAPSQAARVRRLAEIACRIGYYAGVPLLLAVRFLA